MTVIATEEDAKAFQNFCEKICGIALQPYRKQLFTQLQQAESLALTTKIKLRDKSGNHHQLRKLLRQFSATRKIARAREEKANKRRLCLTVDKPIS